MLSVLDGLLREIHAEASRRSMTRSGLLAAAARQELSSTDPATVEAAVAYLEECFAAAPSFDSGELVRLDRDEMDVRDRNRI